MKDNRTTGSHEAVTPLKKNSGRTRAVSGNHEAYRPVKQNVGRSPAAADSREVSNSNRQNAGQGYTADSQKTMPTERQRISPRKKRVLYIGTTALAAVLIIIVAIVLKNATTDRSYETYFNQARQSYYSGDYDSALSDLRKAAAVEKTEECLMLMIDCYCAEGNTEKALELLRQMDLSDPVVASRIAALETENNIREDDRLITVLDEQYVPETTGFVMNDKGLDSSALQEIAGLYALTNLSVSGNNIDDISALAGLGGLTTLNLSSNSVSDLSPLSSLPCLRTLYLDSNPITDFSPLYALTSLTTLSIKNIDITENQLKALSEALPSCAIHSDNAIEDILDISLGGVTFKSDVEELSLGGMGITDISALSGCKHLKRLDLMGNKVSDLSPLMDIPGLEWLNIKDNRVSDLRPLMGIRSLTYINAEGNEISSTVPLSSLSSLMELYLAANPITDFSGLKKLSAIETLGLEDTGVVTETLEMFKSLTSLRLLLLEGNMELDGDVMDEVKTALPLCRIYHSELIYSIELGGQRFRQDIKELNAANLGIEDISCLSSCTQLEKLYLQNNNVTNIYILEWVKSIKELNLSNNGLQDISAIANLDQLEVLDLSNNQIDRVNPLLLLENLRELHIGGNALTQDQIDQLREALPNCTIYSD